MYVRLSSSLLLDQSLSNPCATKNSHRSQLPKYKLLMSTVDFSPWHPLTGSRSDCRQLGNYLSVNNSICGGNRLNPRPGQRTQHLPGRTKAAPQQTQSIQEAVLNLFPGVCRLTRESAHNRFTNSRTPEISWFSIPRLNLSGVCPVCTLTAVHPTPPPYSLHTSENKNVTSKKPKTTCENGELAGLRRRDGPPSHPLP
jgi:hypothetical protein